MRVDDHVADQEPTPVDPQQKPPVFDKRLVTGIAVLVSTVWGISFIADIVLKTYDPSPFIHLAMMTVVGAVVGHGFIRGGGGQ